MVAREHVYSPGKRGTSPQGIGRTGTDATNGTTVRGAERLRERARGSGSNGSAGGVASFPGMRVAESTLELRSFGGGLGDRWRGWTGVRTGLGDRLRTIVRTGLGDRWRTAVCTGIVRTGLGDRCTGCSGGATVTPQGKGAASGKDPKDRADNDETKAGNGGGMVSSGRNGVDRTMRAVAGLGTLEESFGETSRLAGGVHDGGSGASSSGRCSSVYTSRVR